jgi:tellurite methyltransferase
MQKGYSFELPLSTQRIESRLLPILLFALISVNSACYRSPNPRTFDTEMSFFQKLTGDDPEGDRSRWDRLFSTPDYVFGKEPAQFLKEKVGEIPVGRALDIAMGEGRNAVFLAKKGFAVEGVDISEVAVQKAKLLARDHSVDIVTTVADLKNYQIQWDSYTLIANIQYLQRSLIPQTKAGLKHGGYVVYENPTVAELQRQPTRNLRRDYLLEEGELKRLFSDFEILSYSEGPNETGEIVARLLARKR